jgi:hypothetical protein
VLQTQTVALWGKKKSVVDVVSHEDADGFYPEQFGGPASHRKFPSFLQQQRPRHTCICEEGGLRCSACHEAWPMLNYFGQKFKDNGYQLMNDRDAPIWQNPSYWPITLRITPFWHRESTDKITYDTPSGGSALRKLTFTGFDHTGLDILTGDTLEKNISFLLVPSSDEFSAFHMESVNVRLDNLFHSPWLNFKLGKFELDNIVSEKRVVTLSSYGGSFNLYHFSPPAVDSTGAVFATDGNIFGQIVDNQLGVDWMGHSANDRTRLSVAVISSTDGNPDVLYGSNSYSAFFAGSPGV